MGQPKINHFALNDIINFDTIDIEGLARKIEAKQPSERSKFEREFLNLYNKANKKGTEFCVAQLKAKAQEFARKNWLILAIVALIVMAAIFSKK